MANETLLVVDDDPAIVHLLREFLEVEGYTVFDGFDGEAALTLASEKRPSLIIMDLHMPGRDGLVVLESLRQMPETNRIPVIMLTGESYKHLLPKLKNMPGVAPLEKPVELSALQALILELLAKFPKDRG